MSDMEFWLSFNNHAERHQLPVLPGEINISQGAENTVVSIARLGQISILQDPVLKEYSFSSQFPATYGPYCAHPNIHPPFNYVRTIERWRSTGRPIRFIVTGTPINVAVSIEDFQYREQAGDVGTLYYDIVLKEYKFIQPRQIELKRNKVTVSSKQQRPNPKAKTKSYTVKRGDTLTTIAKKAEVYGDSSEWRKIWTANKEMLAKRDSRNLQKPGTYIYPGQRLVIP